VDEALGPSATISAVLYSNVNHPELKRDFQSKPSRVFFSRKELFHPSNCELQMHYNNCGSLPDWNERSKQIAKIWRSLPTDKRAPYLQKARENRAACRMVKAQQVSLDMVFFYSSLDGWIRHLKKMFKFSLTCSKSKARCGHTFTKSLLDDMEGK